MADQSADLISHVQANPPAGKFAPCACYGADEDALMFYFRNAPDYAKRINSRVTFYLSMDDDKLVGCQIKGVGRILRELGELELTLKHRKIKLTLVLLAMMEPMLELPESYSRAFREVYRHAKETDVDLEIAQLV